MDHLVFSFKNATAAVRKSPSAKYGFQLVVTRTELKEGEGGLLDDKEKGAFGEVCYPKVN